jgi:hypothetical protein
MPLLSQLFSQPRRALGGPPEWRHRVATRYRVKQSIQGRQQLRILVIANHLAWAKMRALRPLPGLRIRIPAIPSVASAAFFSHSAFIPA